MKKEKKLGEVLNRMAVSFTGALALLIVIAVFSKPQSGLAAPGDLSSAAAKYPNIVGSSLQACDLCHTSNIPSLNPYGAAYKANGRNSAAFGLIENLDSDGDGFKNIQEISALTFPGNPASFPAVPTPTNTAVFTNTPVATNTVVATSTTIPGVTSTPVSTNIPVSTSTPISTIPVSAFVTIDLTSSSVTVGGTSAVAVNLNNIPIGGFASAEFTCAYNSTLVEISNITVANLFGTDPVSVVNGPQNGSFIVAIAGSNGNKATTSGPAFTFSSKGLQVGQSAIDCQARVSPGNQSLTTIPSTPANMTTTSAQGTFAGQVLANKPVTVTLYNPDTSVAGSVAANVNGTFSLSVSAGTYTAVASAPGYLKAQGTFTVSGGNTTTAQTISPLAGDIDGNDVIDQFDALTIGINYNGSTPTAADLNNDGVINVLDMEILAQNYRQAGALAWQ